jgi:hypothetical protein
MGISDFFFWNDQMIDQRIHGKACNGFNTQFGRDIFPVGDDCMGAYKKLVPDFLIG